jgi:hypothetical protein
LLPGLVVAASAGIASCTDDQINTRVGAGAVLARVDHQDLRSDAHRMARRASPGTWRRPNKPRMDERAYRVIFDMPKRQPYARIAITLPRSVLATADDLARTNERSRSWIIADAIRRYAAPSAGALGDSRQAQLRRDMELTPEQRVRAAEETLRLTDRLQPVRRQQARSFERYEDFLDWKDSNRASPR